MPHYIEKADMMTLPVIPLRGIVAFPGISLSFEITNELSVKICEKADADDNKIFIVNQKEITEKITKSNLYTVGVTAKIKQYVKLPEGNVRVIIEGLNRAFVLNYYISETDMSADIINKQVLIENEGGIKGAALIHEVHTVFEKFAGYLPKMSNELILSIQSIKSPEILADYIACNILVNLNDKQKILEEFDPLKRLELLAYIMETEMEILNTEMQIHKKVRSQIDHNQREYYLREQLKVIQNELGIVGDGDSDTDEYYEKINKTKLPVDVELKLMKELKKLSKTPFNSAENGVIKNYLDVCLELPWSKLSKDRIDIEAANKILERDHDGLEKIKERIIEFLAVKQLNPKINNQILCLVGPPGTGKTSIVESIARAMKRHYVRISLGGIRDEADIRGHRKTYVGAMPGRIINALRQAGTRNPIILFDEIDKLTRDAHGDPASAMLEVLDSEQNKAFRDHFIELPVDLSECMFITTANTVDTIPRPLLDRMEVIELKIYTRHEKLAIANNHLIPKQMKRHGLNKKQLQIEENALLEIIDFYTHEAGVRNLEREIANICRKTAKNIVKDNIKKCIVTPENISQYLGSKKLKPEKISDIDEIGEVNGLAYTELGGDMLKIEVAVMAGTGKIELTGSLGDVMKESARAAVSYIRTRADDFGIDGKFYKNKDIHIHVPEGAIPKDGPSAGVTIVTALVSELSGKPVKRDVAMTGEITLRGKVLPIGGLKEKVMAAYKAGINTVLIPADNENDIEDIDRVARQSIKFIMCKNMDDVLKNSIIH